MSRGSILDEVPPPPTYEVTLLNGEAAAAAAQQSTENEAPPPYSLVDPTKVHQASMEVIDLEDQVGPRCSRRSSVSTSQMILS